MELKTAENNPALVESVVLDETELAAFRDGDVAAVEAIGRDFVDSYRTQVFTHADSLETALASGSFIGLVRDIQRQPGYTPTTWAMREPFLLAVQAQQQRRAKETAEFLALNPSEQDAQLKLAGIMGGLRKLADDPRVHEIVEENSRRAFDDLMTAATALANKARGVA